MPPGDKVKVLQIITQQKMDGEEENLLNVTERNVKLGNYKSYCIVVYCIEVHPSHYYSLFIFNIGKSLEPDGKKIGEGGGDKQQSTNAFDLARFTSLYEHHNRIPPTQDAFARYRGVEEDLFYLVNFLMENNQSLLDGDFITQVMTQFDGRPVEMMEYVEEYVANAKRAEMMISIDPPPPVETPPASTLQIASGPAYIEDNDTVEMDTREKSAKRQRDVPALTRAQSKANVLEIGN